MADEPEPGGDQVEFAQNVTGDEDGRPALLAEPVQLIPVVASGRLAREKDHLTLIRALTIAGRGPLERRLKAEASRQLDSMPVSIGFHQNVTTPRKITPGCLRQGLCPYGCAGRQRSRAGPGIGLTRLRSPAWI